MDDEENLELVLPTGRHLSLPISELMLRTGLSREQVLAAADVIGSLNLVRDEN